jgi:hypothetical protein
MEKEHMNDDPVATSQQRQLFEETYKCLVESTKECIRSLFVPDRQVRTLVTGLLISPDDPSTAMFTIAVRQGGYGKAFFISLHGSAVTIAEQKGKEGQPWQEFKAELREDARTYLQASLNAMASKPPDRWHT